MLAMATTTAKNELTGSTNSQIFGNLMRPMFWDMRPVSIDKLDCDYV
jgi:hypothetical protein